MRLTIVLLLVLARAAAATTYWVDTSKAGGSGCGSAQATACKNWHDLIVNNNGIKASIVADTVNVVSGTYAGNGNGQCWLVGTSTGRTASSPLVIQCTDASGTYAPGTCTVTGAGVTITSGDALVGIGRNNCGSDGTNYGQAQYVQWKGINVISGTQTNRNLVGLAPVDHILLRDMTIDGGTTSTSDLFITDNGCDHISQVNVTVTNCSVTGSYGCNAYQRSNHLALIGSTFGPARVFPNIPINSNNDALSIIGSDTVLEDGNTIVGMTDGIDHSQLDINRVGHVISRFNDTRDIVGGATQSNNALNDHNFKISGDDPTATPAGPLAIYKNVLRFTNTSYWIGGFWTTERAQDVDFWYNDVYCPWHRGVPGSADQTNACITLTPGTGGNAGPFLYNIFDGPDTVVGVAGGGAFPMEVCPFGSTNCSASAMRWVKNGLWFAERGASAGCIRFNIAGDNANFQCDLARIGGGTAFNSTGNNSGNFRADPAFLARSISNQTLAGLQLTGSSGPYLDAGGAFCTADAGGTAATSVVVTCGAAAGGAAVFNDPKHYFPDPNDYYGVVNADCLAKGVRAVDAGGGGCFDLQIAGGSAGKREVTSTVTATRTINFTPAATWSAGAMVHVPWAGTAPDLGAIEKVSGATTTTTSTVTTTTVTTSTSSTTTTTLTATPQHFR